MDTDDPSQLRYRDTSKVTGRIETAYQATRAYLAEQVVASRADH